MVISLLDKDNKFRTLADLEEEIIQSALKFCDGSVTVASKTLGVSRSTLYRKLKERETTDDAVSRDALHSA